MIAKGDLLAASPKKNSQNELFLTAYVLIDSIIKEFVMMMKISKIKFMLY